MARGIEMPGDIEVPGGMRVVALWSGIALLALGSCTAAQKQADQGPEARSPDEGAEHDREEHDEHEGGEEGRKRWSGRSFEALTRVAATPWPSPIAPGFEAERVWSGHDDWEPAIAAAPGSPHVYQMVTRYGRTCRGCASPALVFRRSTDGGATWEADRYFIPSKRKQNDPQIEVAEDGTIYTAFMLGYRPGVCVSKSRDRGATWTEPRPVADRRRRPRWSDKPALVISPDGGQVYVAFNASDSYVAVSHDAGATFAEPVQTSDDGRYWFHFQGAMGPDGAVCFVAVDYDQDYTGTQNIQVLCSRDQGQTWNTTRVGSSAGPVDCSWAEGCYHGYFGAAAGLAIDRAGTIMVVYTASETDGAPPRLYARTSSDGVTWSPRRRLSVDEPGVINAFPTIAAGPTPGDFRISWQDARNGQRRWNTWYRRTEDGGQRWSEEVRLSDQAGGAPYKHARGYAFPYGDYHEMAVDGSGVTHVIWGESISYTGPGGAWYTRGL